MNDHLKISPHGLQLIQDFEGAPRLTARLCEGGAWELGWGCTYYPDNSSVKEGDTIDPEFAPVMLQHAITITEDAVKRLAKIPLTQHQFDGLCGFVYNVGEANAATSTVIRETNAGRFEDASAAFGMWVFATKGSYKQALRGLLRRRYAEACTYLGYHYAEACADEAVALQRQKPDKLPGADRVLYKTPFANILRVAQRYPLSASPVAADAKVAIPAPLEPVAYERAGDRVPDSAMPEIPVQLPMPDPFEEDELLLDTPAAPPAAVAKGAAPEPPPSSAPARVPQPEPNTGDSKPASPVPVPVSPPSPPGQASSSTSGPVVAEARPASAAPPPILPPVPPPPKPVVIAPKSIDIRAIPYGEIDPQNGAKNMTDSKRVIGMVIVGAGSLVQILAGREIISSTIGAVFFDMSRDPVVVALAAGAIMMFAGWITRKRGTKIMTDGMKNATQVLK